MAKKATAKGEEKKKVGAPIGNKNAVGNEGGRPPLFATTEELETKVNAYFEYIKGEFHYETRIQKNPITGEMEANDVVVWDRHPEPATVTGLTLFLGFADRSSLYEYQEKVEFSHIIKKARTRVEFEYEKCLYNDRPTGALFALKNMGWKDKSEIDHKNDGGKFEVPAHDFSKLTTEQLEALKKLHE